MTSINNPPKKAPSLKHVGRALSSKTLQRSKTVCPNKTIRRDRSQSLKGDIDNTEALTQVMNFVSKRFITHQGGGGGTKEGRHGKKERSTDPSAEYITINVSGVTFKTKLETLSRYPNTLLGKSCVGLLVGL